MSRRFLEALLLRDLSELRRAMLNEPLMRKDSNPRPAPVSEIGADLGAGEGPAAEIQLPSAQPAPQVAVGGQERPRKQ